MVVVGRRCEGSPDPRSRRSRRRFEVSGVVVHLFRDDTQRSRHERLRVEDLRKGSGKRNKTAGTSPSTKENNTEKTPRGPRKYTHGKVGRL